MMKVGIDSYCYHRLFGEVYPGQDKPEKELSFEGFMEKVDELDIDGVSLETCFIPRFDDAYLAGIKSWLDRSSYDRVYAWGHPDFLDAVATDSSITPNFKTGLETIRVLEAGLESAMQRKTVVL